MAGVGLMQYENQLLVQKYHAGSIAAFLRAFEYERAPHGTFITALNCLLVWAGARPATLPPWSLCNKDSVRDFIAHLNSVSQQLLQPCPAEVVILERPQVYTSQRIIIQSMVTRRGNPGISFDLDSVVEDAQIGRELGMYPPNARLFAEGHDLSQMGFSVWEAGADALVYSEAWSEHLLTDAQCQEFLRRCQDCVHLWNETMKNLGLEYRFYGTMDWNRRETPFHKAKNTLRLFGKTHLGSDSRCPTPYRAPGFHQVNFTGQSPQWTHAVRG